MITFVVQKGQSLYLANLSVSVLCSARKHYYCKFKFTSSFAESYKSATPVNIISQLGVGILVLGIFFQLTVFISFLVFNRHFLISIVIILISLCI